MLNGSKAVTVKENVEPAIAVFGTGTAKCEAAAGLTTIVPIPAIDAVTVSAAVIVWLPAVFSVAEKVPTPFVNVEFTGNVAAPSLLVKWTVPA